MICQHFGLTHEPLGKQTPELWDDGALSQLKQRFTWPLERPGIGLLTGKPGAGKTAALRSLTAALNPHRYLVLYQPETDFGRLDLYRALALALGLEPPHRRAALWRALKARIPELFRDLPAFLNFAFDSRDLITLWLLGHPLLARPLAPAPYAALAGPIQVRGQIAPILERERFASLIAHGLQQAGSQQPLLSDSALALLRQASQGLPRRAALPLKTALQLAAAKGLNHLPEELIQPAIEALL